MQYALLPNSISIVSILFPRSFRCFRHCFLQFCLKTLNPQWLEQFDLHMYQEQPKVLEITVWDKDFGGRNDFMGR